MEKITETSAEKHVLIPVECIQPDSNQPRVFFDKDKLYRLSLSLKKRGQKQPIIVKQIEGPVDYQIIDGERRWRACQLAQIDEIKAIVIEVKDEQEQFEISCISNFGREAHTPMEIANAVKRLRSAHHTIEEIADWICMSRATVYNYSVLLNLAPEVQEMLNPEDANGNKVPDEKRLKLVTAFQIAQFNSKQNQIQHAQYILDNRLNVAQARIYLKRVMSRSDAGSFQLRQMPKLTDKVRMLVRFIDNLKIKNEEILEMSRVNFDEFFFNKSYFEVRDVLDTLTEAGKTLVEIRDAVKRVAERKKSQLEVVHRCTKHSLTLGG